MWRHKLAWSLVFWLYFPLPFCRILPIYLPSSARPMIATVGASVHRTPLLLGRGRICTVQYRDSSVA